MTDESHESIKRKVDEKFARPEWREIMEAIRAHEAISWSARAMNHMDGEEAKIDELHSKLREYRQWSEEQSAWLAAKWRKLGDDAETRKTARAYFNCAQDIEEFFKPEARSPSVPVGEQK